MSDLTSGNREVKKPSDGLCQRFHCLWDSLLNMLLRCNMDMDDDDDDDDDDGDDDYDDDDGGI